jgi:signal transduction histidine kinase
MKRFCGRRREALANIGRHARASNVLVSLTASSGHVEIRIRDDGAGFDPNQTRGGQGIANIHARAEEFGGTLELISRPGSGTSVTLSIPYTTAETAQKYRRKAMTSAVLLMISIAYLVWEKSPFMTTVSVGIVWAGCVAASPRIR